MARSFVAAVYKSDSPQYPSSSLLSQAMVIADGSLGTLTSLAAVRQVTGSEGSAAPFTPQH